MASNNDDVGVQLNSSQVLERFQDASQSSSKEEEIQHFKQAAKLLPCESHKEEDMLTSHTDENLICTPSHKSPPFQQMRNNELRNATLNYALDDSDNGAKTGLAVAVGVLSPIERDDINKTLPRQLNHDNTPGAYAVSSNIDDGANGNANADANATAQRPVQIVTEDSSARNGLVEAEPVMDASLQQAQRVEEMDPEANRQSMASHGSSKTSSTDPKTITACSIAALVVGLLFVVLVLVLSLGHHEDKDATMAPITNINSSSSPTVSPTLLEDQIEDLLPDFSREALSESSSPQRQAFDWLLGDPNVTQLLEDQPERILNRFALATLYFATKGDAWVQNDHWLDYEIHECDWVLRKENFNGAREDDQGGAPQACAVPEGEVGIWEEGDEGPSNNTAATPILRNIWLDTNNLDGTLPMEIFAISTLYKISLVNNPQLQGSLQGPQLHTASSLKELSISATHLSGSIPTDIATLASLNFLVLAANRHTGTLPTELGLLRDLLLLIVDSNQFTGTIPSVLGGLPILSTLFLSNNQLSGTIPTQLGQLYFLRALSLGDNQLMGSIPSQLGTPPNTTFLALNDNTNLAGTIPQELARPFFLLNLVHTGLSGLIPSPMCFTPQLFHDCNEAICGCRCNCTTAGEMDSNWTTSAGTLQMQHFE